MKHALFLPLRLLFLATLLGSCNAQAPEPEPGTVAAANEETATGGEEIAQEVILVDTHIDVPYRLFAQLEESGSMDDVSKATDGGDFDYPRARAGGLDAAFMSIYVPADRQEDGTAKAHADALIDMMEELVESAPDKFALATSPAEIEMNFEKGLLSLPLGMENGAPVETLEDLHHFFDRGIRYITLTHSKNNQISDSSYEPPDNRKWNGLSPFGEEVVAEMNRLGILVDISHVSDDAFWRVMELTKAPAIASHSSCRSFTPDFERNMSDEMIRALAENGGVIQINFGSSFLDGDIREASQAGWDAVANYARENGLERGDPKLQEFLDQYRAENPQQYADLADVVAHIDHVVKLVGIDHVGIGSDYDGVGDSLPTGLKDVSQFPNLFKALLEKGYSEEDVLKIAGDNVLRVWRETEEVARKLSEES